MAIKAGFDAKIFVGSAGAKATTELTLARDSNGEGNANAIDASNRGSANKEYIYGLKDQSITVTILDDPADPGYKIILDAYLNNKVIAVFNSDGEGNGWSGDFIVGSFSDSEPLEDVCTKEVTFNPAANKTQEMTYISGGVTSSASAMSMAAPVLDGGTTTGTPTAKAATVVSSSK